jgi:WhiB family redox-sensing transcriptional regulator
MPGAFDYPALRDATADWMVNAACRDAGVDFFPDHMSTPAAAHAVAVCQRCPVQDACARYAIVNDIEYGIWGGLSPRARREIASSRTNKDRTREMLTYNTYQKHRDKNRTDPVKATARDLGISTATVYHHVRIIKFKLIFEQFGDTNS